MKTFLIVYLTGGVLTHVWYSYNVIWKPEKTKIEILQELFYQYFILIAWPVAWTYSVIEKSIEKLIRKNK
jgi:hypothetical protein